jgi:death-on-curing protein
MTAWRWIGAELAYAIHDRQIAEHGGLDGLRDPDAVESALGRPRKLAAYGSPDAADLAAAYAFGIARNHGFLDGNKRTAWVIARVFLLDHGQRLRFEPAEAVRVMESVAAGTLREGELAAWFRERARG